MTHATALDARVAFLCRRESYPDHPERVEPVETHMAWVFLAGEHAYKMKKPVRYPFLDFSTLEAREEDCRREVRLNRRLAPEVYLGVVPLTREPTGRLALNGPGEPVEWLVVMRRLPRSRLLDQSLKRGTVDRGDLKPVARLLARFYRDARREPVAAAEYVRRIERELYETLDELGVEEFGLERERLGGVRTRLLGRLDEHRPLLAARARGGHVVEGHGDLRPEHVYLGPPPAVIDCLEFRREFRVLDPADELAFLSMECRRLGAPWVGDVFFEEYTSATEDAPPAELVDFYASRRACIRAKLAAWHSREDGYDTRRWLGQAENYLELAETLLPGIHSGPERSVSESPA